MSTRKTAQDPRRQRGVLARCTLGAALICHAFPMLNQTE